MIRKGGLVWLLALIVAGCSNKSGEPNPVAISNDWLTYEVGDTWTYNKMIIMEDAGTLPLDIPDTMWSYVEFEAAKDTVFNDATWLIIEGIEYDCGMDTVQTFYYRCAVTFNDTALVVNVFKEGTTGLSPGPFKATAEVPFVTPDDFINSTTLYAKMTALKTAADYDTAVFRDQSLPVVFGLDPGDTWSIRHDDNPYTPYDVEKKYLGQDDVTVPAGTFRAYKYEVLPVPGVLDSTTQYVWYNGNGMLKRWQDFGRMDVTDAAGAVIGSFLCWNVCEYTGTGKVDKNLLVPWGG